MQVLFSTAHIPDPFYSNKCLPHKKTLLKEAKTQKLNLRFFLKLKLFIKVKLFLNQKYIVVVEIQYFIIKRDIVSWNEFILLRSLLWVISFDFKSLAIKEIFILKKWYPKLFLSIIKLQFGNWSIEVVTIIP